jgi:hypothetical protein
MFRWDVCKCALYLFFLQVCLFFLIGCGSSNSNSNTNTTSTSSTAAPSGTVISVDSTSGSFVLQESSGTEITVDTISGTTYQYTTTSTASTAAVGGWVAAQGTISNGQLIAADVAFVPTPPSNIAQWDVETTSTGTIYFGQITAVQNGLITITTGDGAEIINPASATAITLTTTSSFQAIQVGSTVEVNGPQNSTTVYTGHQLNIGLTPAVVGQFD